MRGLCIHPSPWSFRPSKIRKGQLIAAAQIVDKDGDIIAKVNAGNTAVMDDVARLMSAAPTLLGALENSLAFISDYRERVIKGEITGNLLTDDYEALAIIRRAIDQAKGENS